MREDKEYAYWLWSIPGVGNRSIEKLLEVCGGTPKEVYYASNQMWKQVLNVKQLESMKQHTVSWNVESEYGRMTEQGITFLTKDDVMYPERLRNIPDAPYGIFVKGCLPREDVLSVAIVGARECSAYGSYIASELGGYLGEEGVQIISGMARGIDGISQEAALKAGGVSFGVLGCGVDICYPAQNRGLYESLVMKGGILSTYPPGELPKTQHFPQRNRIVSGLADVVVVVEARCKSGTLITVDMALEQGRDVYVVPGRVTDRLSDGCNSLIRQGAGVVLSPTTFLEEVRTVWEERKNALQNRRVNETVTGKTQEDGIGCCGKRETEESLKRRKTSSRLSGDMLLVYEALDWYPLSLEQIAAKLPDAYSVVTIHSLLLQLCMEQLAVQLSPGCFCLGEE